MNISEMIQALKEAQDSAPKPFDTPAEVVRVEGETTWVQIPGSDDETPVNMTIAAKEGDTVQVRVSGGTAFLVGNATAPPTDDTEAYVAQARAEEVQADLNEQKEYFWHDDDGAHIQGNLSGYRNDLRSDGMHIIDTASGEEIATFSDNLVSLGKNSEQATIKFCDELVNVYTERFIGQQTAEAVVCIDDTYNPIDLTTEYSSIVLLSKNRLGSNQPKEAIIKVTSSAHSNESYVVLDADQIELQAGFIYLGGDIRTSTGSIIPQTSTTTWTAPTASGATKTAGGYYTEGKHVYVSIQCKLNSAASADDNVTLFTGLPGTLFETPLTCMIANSLRGIAWITTGGALHIRPTVSVTTSNTVVINGHYTSA